jgi:hypothetical protein
MKAKPTIVTAVVFIAVFVAWTLWIGRLKQEAKLTSTLNRGRNIFALLTYREDVDHFAVGATSPYPGSGGQDSTSTEYFQRMMDEGILAVDAGFFGAPGIGPDQGDILTRMGNAWCVNASSGRDTPKHVPLLFTRNLHFSLSGSNVVASLSNEAPFGKRDAAIVLWDGTPLHVRSRDLDDLTRNLLAAHVQNILRP